MTDCPDTVTEAVALLRVRGYTDEVDLFDGLLRWRHAGARCSTDDAVVDALYRFEGDSDPGDEMIVFGLRDAATGSKGSLAAAFGYAADPEVIQHLSALSSRFQR